MVRTQKGVPYISEILGQATGDKCSKQTLIADDPVAQIPNILKHSLLTIKCHPYPLHNSKISSQILLSLLPLLSTAPY